MNSSFKNICTSDAYQCKTWYILQFFKRPNKCRKCREDKKLFFVAHFHMGIRPCTLTPFDLHLKFCTKWKTLYCYIILEDSRFSSNFREVIVAIILNLFWVVFHGILTQMSSSLYKSFTSDAIKLRNEWKKKEFLNLRAFWFTLSWRNIIVVSSVSIVFALLS